MNRDAYLPDSLTLEAAGWKPCPSSNPAWVKEHPTKPGYGCRLWPYYETGKLCLVEHEKRAKGQPISPGLKVFAGYCRDAADFATVLRLVQWTNPD